MNPLFERFQQKRQQLQQNQNPFSSPEAFQQASNQMMEKLNKIGMTPEGQVRQLMQKGQMTQEQFSQLSQQANQIYRLLYGKNHY